MKVYKIKTLNDYSSLMLLMMREGSKDMMNEEIPLFSDQLQLYKFFDISDRLINLLYDDDGMEKWDTQKYDLPRDWLDMIGSMRMTVLKLTFPFFVVVEGHSGWNRTGYNESRTFFECQEIQEIQEIKEL